MPVRGRSVRVSRDVPLAPAPDDPLGGVPDPALQIAGTEVHAQWWARDPGFAPPCNTSLSNAIEYTIAP